MNPENDNQPVSDVKAKAIGILFLVLIVVAGFFIIGLQCFAWLRSGIWFPMSLIDGLHLISQSPWITDPQDWIGIHDLLEEAPLSAILIGGGGLFLFGILND